MQIGRQQQSRTIFSLSLSLVSLFIQATFRSTADDSTARHTAGRQRRRKEGDDNQRYPWSQFTRPLIRERAAHKRQVGTFCKQIFVNKINSKLGATVCSVAADWPARLTKGRRQRRITSCKWTTNNDKIANAQTNNFCRFSIEGGDLGEPLMIPLSLIGISKASKGLMRVEMMTFMPRSCILSAPVASVTELLIGCNGNALELDKQTHKLLQMSSRQDS